MSFCRSGKAVLTKKVTQLVQFDASEHMSLVNTADELGPQLGIECLIVTAQHCTAVNMITAKSHCVIHRIHAKYTEGQILIESKVKRKSQV